MSTRNLGFRTFVTPQFGVILFWLVSLTSVSAAHASSFTASGGTTARLGTKVISAGDSQKKVLDAGGSPVRRTDIVNGFGMKLGERWTYKSGNGRHTVVEFDNNGNVLGVRDVIGQ